MVHCFPDAVAPEDDPCSAGEIRQADLELVEVVQGLVDVGHCGDEGVVNGVEGRVHP